MSGSPLTTLQHIVAALRDPRAYPHPARNVEVHETHISIVLAAGAFAYKLKKPLDLGFLDFGTLAKRRAACEEEVRLNRRTAPGLYLGVVPIGGTAESPRLGVEPAIEYAVQMQRFPQEALLDRINARGALDLALLEGLARDLAAFHAAAADARALPHGRPEEIRTPALQNFDQLAGLVIAEDRALLADLRAWTEAELARCSEAFWGRRAAGRVRECHGDLHLGNLVRLDGRAVPFDGIEFNAELRWIDVMNEVAFLVMDLVDHARPDLAWRFLDAYLAATGDYDGLRVLRFYLVYRAMVRAKIACIRAHQPDLDVHGRTRADAEHHSYLLLAGRLRAPRRPALLVMHGLSGSGKSRTAAALVARLGAVRIRSDVERKRLHGLDWNAAGGTALDQGLYSPEATLRTYARLEALAEGIIAAGYTAIVDAAFLRRDERDAFARLAARHAVPFAIVSCTAGVATLRSRIVARAASGHDPSEATVAVLDRQLATQEPIAADERAATMVIDTGVGDEAIARALDAVAARLAE